MWRLEEVRRGSGSITTLSKLVGERRGTDPPAGMRSIERERGVSRSEFPAPRFTGAVTTDRTGSPGGVPRPALDWTSRERHKERGSVAHRRCSQDHTEARRVALLLTPRLSATPVAAIGSFSR